MTRIWRYACALLVATVLSALLPAFPAEAGSRYLCSGYVGCKSEDYSHFGYKQAGQQMWWRMYPGHNCTNYVAYRLVRGGMPNERPWSGDGDAKNWGRVKSGITDQTPMVGSVAWWKANVPGAGSSGHVAYVERVISNRKIVVSEDSWSGDFHWRVITKRGTGWPTGFIHFDDRAVRALTPPVISGRPTVGQTLSATTGRWTPAASYRYQWFAGSDEIRGATGDRLQVTPGLRGRTIAVRVYARQRGYLEGRATSERTAAVAPGTHQVTARPAMAGTPRVGQVLQLQPGSWTPAPDAVSIRWYAAGEPIRGATGPQLVLDRTLIDKRITVRTTARSAGYRASQTTAEPTARVQPGRFSVTTPFGLEGRPVVGGRLLVLPGAFTPSAASVTYQWLRDGRPVKDATGRSYALAATDLGDRLSVRVLLRHPGYEARTVTLTTTERVATVPELRLVTEGRPGRAVVRVRVLAPGVESPRGPVTVRVDGREVHDRVVDGRATLVLRDVDQGRHRVRVLYDGAGLVLPARASAWVRVPAS